MCGHLGPFKFKEDKMEIGRAELRFRSWLPRETARSAGISRSLEAMKAISEGLKGHLSIQHLDINGMRALLMAAPAGYALLRQLTSEYSVPASNVFFPREITPKIEKRYGPSDDLPLRPETAPKEPLTRVVYDGSSEPGPRTSSFQFWKL